MMKLEPVHLNCSHPLLTLSTDSTTRPALTGKFRADEEKCLAQPTGPLVNHGPFFCLWRKWHNAFQRSNFS